MYESKVCGLMFSPLVKPSVLCGCMCALLCYFQTPLPVNFIQISNHNITITLKITDILFAASVEMKWNKNDFQPITDL